MASDKQNKRDAMSTPGESAGERESAEPQKEANSGESLTDLIDRMDREAFQRTLAHRDLKVT